MRWVRKFGSFLGTQKTAKDIISELQEALHRDQEIVRLRQMAGWDAMEKLLLRAVIDLDAEIVQYGVNPEKHKEEIRSLYAWRNAILGLLAISEATENQFVERSQELSVKLKQMRDFANGPLSSFYHEQGGPTVPQKE